MKRMKSKNISKVMNILIKHYGKHKHSTVRRSADDKKPFKALIACLLSLRTKDENTAIAVRNLFKHVKKPEDIIKMPIRKLERLIYVSGHYRKKARTLKHVSRVILEKYKGKVPSKKSELLSIKGVGPKTANIILCFSFGKKVIPVDTHVYQISNRLGWVKTRSPEQTEKQLEKILPKKYWKEFNTIMVLFGKSICVPISPFCSRCPIRRYCKRIGIVRSR